MDNLSWCPVHHPQVVHRIIDEEAVIVVPDTGHVGVLNTVGSRIWELIDGQRSIEDLAELITTEFEVTLDQAREDVTQFVEELIANKMLA